MMSMAMVYPSQPQTMMGESTATATATGNWQRGDGSSRLTRSSSVLTPPEPVFKRTATVREILYSEPMQGLQIVNESDDDDSDEVAIDFQSDEVISSSTEEYIHNASPDPPIVRRSKPLPQIPVYAPELQYEPSMYHHDESSSPITPTKSTGESPFLMIPTQLETIQESLDSAIEEELSCKHEEEEEEEYEADSEEDYDLDSISEEYADKVNVEDARSVSEAVSYDEKTTIEEEDDDPATANVNLATTPTTPTTPMTNNDEAASVASSVQFQKPFEPSSMTNTTPLMGHMQIPHTPEATQPPTVWSVDNVGTDNDSDDHSVLRRRGSKEELPPQKEAHRFPSNISLCSRCSSVSSASTSALSNNDLLRAAVAHPLTRASSSAVSLHTHSRSVTPGWDHHQQPLVPRPPRPGSLASSTPSLHKSQSTPHLPAQPAALLPPAPEATVASGPIPQPLLEPTPLKSRYSMASFSLTHDKDSIKTYRRMARKLNNTDFQMTYTKYLVYVAGLYKENKTNHDTRERLLTEAKYWIEKLAKKGVPEALFIKAKWYLQPELEDCPESYRTKPQPAKAFKCLHAAASMGWVEAYYELARLQKSRGEFDRAVEGFKKAASKGHTLATYKMAKILLRGQLQQSRNIKLGLQYLQKAADATDPDSAEPAYVLSCVYADELERIGIARDSTMSRKNPPLAMQYLHKAVQAGLPMALHRMGQVHEHGLLNQPCDPWLGHSFYLRAAEDGHEGAMLDLSRLYAQGIPGRLMHQHEIAFKWCQRAAAKGLQEAEYVLGTYYEGGVGTRPDYSLALEYYSKAASKGYAPASEMLNFPTASSPATAAATAVVATTDEHYQSTANRLSSLRIKKQPAAERPIDDEPAMDSVKETEPVPACHIM